MAAISCNEMFSVYLKFFVYKFLQDLESFRFVFKISKMDNVYSRLQFHLKMLSINLLRSASILVNRIIFNRSNGLMTYKHAINI